MSFLLGPQEIDGAEVVAVSSVYCRIKCSGELFLCEFSERPPIQYPCNTCIGGRTSIMFLTPPEYQRYLAARLLGEEQ